MPDYIVEVTTLLRIRADNRQVASSLARDTANEFTRLKMSTLSSQGGGDTDGVKSKFVLRKLEKKTSIKELMAITFGSITH